MTDHLLMIRNSKRKERDRGRAAAAVTSAETIHTNLNDLLFVPDAELMLATIDEAHALTTRLREERTRLEMPPARRRGLLLAPLGVLAIAVLGVVSLQPGSYTPAPSQIEAARPSDPPSSAMYPAYEACTPLHPQSC